MFLFDYLQVLQPLLTERWLLLMTSQIHFYRSLMSQKLILLQIASILVQYLELPLILKVFDEHINLLLDL
jgi:hypothetical protein